MTDPVPRGGRARTLAFYVGTLALAVLAFHGIRAAGEGLSAPPGTGAAAAPAGGAAAKSPNVDALPHVLLALAVIVVVSRLVGYAFHRIHQPRVIGEVVAGILIGPTLLGRIAPEVQAYLLPPAAAPHLGILAQVGVILFMFLVGLELDPALLRARTHAAIAVSHASIVAPFLLGSALALLLYPRLSSSDVRFEHFALFLGVAMSVTAFPVLARILTDRGIQSTPVGALALSCAAVDDVTAWCLLAFLVSVVRSEGGSALVVVAETAAYVGFLVFVVRPLVKRFARFHGDRDLRQGWFAIALVAVLASAFATELIGIHALFGAFVLGAIVPPESSLARQLRARIHDLVVVLLLPAYFAFTGMRTQLGLVSGLESWLLCGLIIAVATAGKLGGSFVAGRVVGLPAREAATIGVLMNTRGLMELVVLNIGLDLGVISPSLFAMLVIMAIVTTFATTPLLSVLWNPAPAAAAAPQTSPPS